MPETHHLFSHDSMMLLRQLISILLLPFVMVVLIPLWYTSGGRTRGWTSGTVSAIGGRVGGAVLFIAGFALFAWCVTLFARKGKGTLAPWDPPKKLVVVGPYRYVRNPMITGVIAMIAGEALYFGSRPIAEWGLLFLVINLTYFILLEEPQLVSRFGDEYRSYKAAVPRWLPRLTPWKPE